MSAVASYKKDLHAILGLSETASPEELRKAYLNLAVKYHPDRNPGDPEAEERFKDISQAYAILSDPAARAKYERLRPQKSPQPKAARPAASGMGARPGASASNTRAQQATGPKPRPANPRPAAGTKSAGAASEKAKPKNSAKSASSGGPSPSEAFKDTDASTQQTSRPETPDNDFDEILSGFFKSDKGRETLRDLEGELGKAGINFKAEDFAEWVRQKQKPPKQAAPDNRTFLEKLASWLPGAEARAQKKAAQYDISYQITLSPQAAASGTTVEISYQQDNAPHRLKVKIPAGIKDGSKLRLTAQGREKPDKTCGDLILSVQVSQPLTLNDLWK